MKKKIISMIAASLMLVAPCLNAGPVAQFMNRAAHCISRMMPASRRLPKEMLDEIVKMKEKSSNSTPIICINSTPIICINSEQPYASAQSIGLSPFHFSILRFNLDHMKTLQGSPFGNTCTLAIIAHELEHAKQNHGGKALALLLAANTISLGSLALRHCLALPESPIILNLTVTVPYFLLAYALKERSDQYKNNNAIRKKWALEAETGAYNTMARCGYRKEIQTLLDQTMNHRRALIDDGSKSLDTCRPMGEIYPTLREMIAYQEAALKECDQHPDTEAPKILASLMLVAPCVHGMADSARNLVVRHGMADNARNLAIRFVSIEKVRAHYAQKPEAWFCNSRSKQLLFSLGQISKPDRFYSENILSADERPDQEYIDEFYKMKEVRKNDTRLAKWPVILKKADLSKASYTAGEAQANADNRSSTHSIVCIDQKVFEKKACPAYNTATLAHELGHVTKGHLSTYAHEIDLRKRQELEAEIEAYKTLAQCGYYKAINTLRNRSLALDIMHTPRGKYFPNVHEELGYQTQALNECRRDIDPKDTQDSKHLMRNSQVTWTQWFSSFFGGRK